MTMRQTECEFCGQTFDSAEDLQTHEEEMHPDEVTARQLDEDMTRNEEIDHDDAAAARLLDDEVKSRQAGEREAASRRRER